jgi:hypothetical protein
LNNVEVIIYLFSNDEKIYDLLKEGVKKPENWFSHLHLGRSEDWIVLKDIKTISIQKKEFAGKIDYLTWVPSPEENYHIENSEKYEENYKILKGRGMLVPAKYELVEINNTLLRNFEWKNVKILESQNYPITITSELFEYLFDEEKNLPLIFTRVSKFEKEGD